jgi:putative peptide zinc metalloprotease protein
MPVDRPTFSESWYRIATLKPRLRSTVQVYRQQFRGQTWHVLQDPASNQFSRLSEPAYRFVGLLDGRRTVADAWQACNEQLGDDAPTQGEVIQLLGQLYVFNLLQSELPPDAEGLFKRYRKRVRREVQGVMANLMFVRIPLLDPDRFLDAIVPVFGWIFSWVGFALWVLILGMGLFALGTHTRELASRVGAMLSNALLMQNVLLFYGSFIGVKIFHELGHALACKKFGRLQGSGGEVHTIGVMLLVLVPMPYVDASSSWAFQKKWHRVVVGSAGMMIELAIASLAAIVWVSTSEGDAVHAVAYHVMFIASISTLIFNGNPLLRFDAYYILSDILEIPNLSQRSKDYLYYLVKRYVWGVRNPRNPATTAGERVWFFFYGIASTIYRVFICVGILWVVSQKLYVLGLALAVGAAIAWVLVPLGKYIKYIFTSPELARTRWRALSSTVLVVLGVIVGLGIIPAEQHVRIDGVVESAQLSVVYMPEDGHVQDILPTGSVVAPDGEQILRAENVEMEARLDYLRARVAELKAEHRIAEADGKIGRAQSLAEQIRILEDEQISELEQRLSRLSISPAHRGEWISPDAQKLQGAYVGQGEPLGMIVDPSVVRIRATAGQEVASLLLSQDIQDIRVRVRGRPDLEFTSTIERMPKAGQTQLPSAALGLSAGGSIQTAPERPTQAAQQIFELWLKPTDETHLRLLHGQRVAIRFTLPERPLAQQWVRRAKQIFQRRRR